MAHISKILIFILPVTKIYTYKNARLKKTKKQKQKQKQSKIYTYKNARLKKNKKTKTKTKTKPSQNRISSVQT